jgi:hypothetical protein
MIDERTKIVRDYRALYIKGQSTKRSLDLYASSSDEAPKYIDDPIAERVAELELTIDTDRLIGFPTKFLNGILYWEVRYLIEVSMGSKEGTLQFKGFCRGRECGGSEIKYEAEERQKRTEARSGVR